MDAYLGASAPGKSSETSKFDGGSICFFVGSILNTSNAIFNNATLLAKEFPVSEDVAIAIKEGCELALQKPKTFREAIILCDALNAYTNRIIISLTKEFL